MKKPITLSLFLIILLSSLNFANAEDEIILFYSNDCEYSREVKELIQENDLENNLDLKMVEENDENFTEIFREALENCEKDPDRGAYPTLYNNGECIVGASSIVDTLYTLADIERDDEEIRVEEGEDMTLVEEERTLEEIFPVQETEEFVPEPRPFYHYILIIVGPALLIWLGYYMIKKLNL